MNKHIFPVVKFPDIRLVSGSGSYVTDSNGKVYLDLNSGQFCASAGHSSKVLYDAMHEFSTSLQDTHTGMLSVQAENGLRALGDISGFDDPYSIILSTGSEAVEFALRYAKHIKEKNGVVAFELGYHGITHGAAAYSLSRTRIRPTVDGSFVIPAPLCKSFDQSETFDFSPSLDALKALLEINHQEIAAFILEPIISGGGMYKVPDGFIREAIALCHQYDVFVVFDECQTGAGRLGRWYSYSNKDFMPDFVVAGKSIGLGLPVSSVTARGESVDMSLVKMEHFSSHQNEAFAGIIVSHFIDWITRENKFNHIKSMGEYLLSRIKDAIGSEKTLPRGDGLMLGFDLTDLPPGPETRKMGNRFVSLGLEEGLLLQHCNNGRTIRVLPNYNIDKEVVDVWIEKLTTVYKKYEDDNICS